MNHTHPLYNTWRKMRDRCNNPLAHNYKWYGAKGITVCKRWDSFDNFKKDMGRKPSPDHTLDRIDSAKGYFKSNCRWATMAEQNNNRSPNHYVIIDGVKKCLSEFIDLEGVCRKTLYRRLNNGLRVLKTCKQEHLIYTNNGKIYMYEGLEG